MGLELQDAISQPPSSDQLEICLIGTGGGYGESVVVHLGNGDWLIVDSCEDPSSHINLPLQYLEQIGVNPAEAVKLIVCTHWHDDHILGISKIIKRCKKAEVCFAKVNDLKKFLRLVRLDFNKLTRVSSLSSTKEFNECIDILEAAGKGIKTAYPDRSLFSSKVNFEIVEVFSLSPSDKAIDNFDAEISQLITEFGDARKKIVIDSPNDRSVVTYIRFGKHKVLLGADLEVTNTGNTGWFDIINNSTVMKGQRASYFKVPHHGSENGYHEKIWSQLLEKDPTANLSPYNLGYGLPTIEMLNTMVQHSSKLYITSAKLSRSKPKKRDRSIEKIIEKFGFKVSEIKFTQGIIRNRMGLGASNWQTEVFGSAFKI